jgi:SPP1 family predicted phage head-tail adaptor
MVNAGDLRHKVTVQSYTITSTGDRGQPVKSWSTYATVPAMIEELGGRKLELARQQVATATHKVTIRYLSQLTVKDRFVFGSLTLNIGSIQNEKLLNFHQECLCTSQEVGS